LGEDTAYHGKKGDPAMGHEYEKDSFNKSLQEWREAREESLEKSPERFDRFRTSAESVVQPLYTPDYQGHDGRLWPLPRSDHHLGRRRGQDAIAKVGIDGMTT